ncbi:hypothetical protein PTKIN_Ptkin06aG0096200 [Pterospermum kingtungense]
MLVYPSQQPQFSLFNVTTKTEFQESKKRKSLDVSETSSGNSSSPQVPETGIKRENNSGRGERVKSKEEKEKPKEVAHTPSFLMASDPNKQVTNSEPVTDAQGSTAVNMAYADKLVADFIVKLDARYKNRLDFSNFKGLIEELKMIGIEHLPPSLSPIHKRI